MENIESVLSTTTVDFPLPAPAVDWEAKYQEAVAQHNLTLASYSTLLDNAGKSMLVISKMFFDEAEIRGWCVEAVEFVERVNDQLPHGFDIPLRKRTFTVSTRVRGWVSTDFDVEDVEASSQEEADEKVRDYADDHFDPDEVLRSVHMRNADIDDIEVDVD